ncbi:MAG: hypothetical protein JNM10_20540 [Planctomycetia bacterium]|nr:hypothetical protein [Planctomycetia bacterium]
MGTRGRTRSLLVVSLLVLAALAWWLATPPAPPEPAVPAAEAGGGRLRVRVVGRDGLGAPAAEVIVRASDGVARTVVARGSTDRDGRWSADELSAREVALDVRAPGCAVRRVDVPDGALRTGSTVVVRPPVGRCAGVVRDAASAPVAARLCLESTIGLDRVRSLPVTASADGRFAFEGLERGEAYFLVAADEHDVAIPRVAATAGRGDLEVWLVPASAWDRFRFRAALLDGAGRPVRSIDWGRVSFEPVAGHPGRRGELPALGGVPEDFMASDVWPPGRYDVTVSVAGYREHVFRSVDLPRSTPPPTATLRP